MLRTGLAVLILCVLPALAHHSTAIYDLVHGTIIGGVVTKFEWQNPHARIALDVTGENNEIEHWDVELESRSMLGRLGWNKDTVKPGDRISITGGRAKDNSFRIRAVTIQLPDGRKLPGLALAEN
ncbi:MAG TPA: DUF6152 family protein [Bryobacteraceae bacterium]|nr:DUF6152 family protein [Bryobacteraceae bacterium]